jgi:PAS domain-containing protein
VEKRQKEKIEELNRDLKKRVADHDQLMNVSDISIISLKLPNYDIVEFNNAMCDTLGFSRQDFKEKFKERLTEYFRGAFAKSLSSLKAQVKRAEESNNRAFSFTIRVPSGQGPKWISKAEAALRDSQRFYREAVRAAKITTWIYDIKAYEILMSEEPSVN